MMMLQTLFYNVMRKDRLEKYQDYNQSAGIVDTQILSEKPIRERLKKQCEEQRLKDASKQLVAIDDRTYKLI